MKKEHVIAGIVIAAIVGAAISWVAKPPEIVEPQPGKFEEVPPPGSTVTLKHGLDAAYPPFTEIDPAGVAVGFDVDVVDWMESWIENEYDIELVIEHTPWEWAVIVTALEEGDLDFIQSGMTHKPERAEKVAFSIPYYVYFHHLVARADDPRTAEEMLNSGEYISVQLGATNDMWAEDLLAMGYNFEKLALGSYALAFEAVLDGRAAATISDSAFTRGYFAERPEAAAALREVGRIGGLSAYAIATRYEDRWLRNALNRALRAIMDTPLWDKLLREWGIYE